MPESSHLQSPCPSTNFSELRGFRAANVTPCIFAWANISLVVQCIRCRASGTIRRILGEEISATTLIPIPCRLLENQVTGKASHPFCHSGWTWFLSPWPMNRAPVLSALLWWCSILPRRAATAHRPQVSAWGLLPPFYRLSTRPTYNNLRLIHTHMNTSPFSGCPWVTRHMSSFPMFWNSSGLGLKSTKSSHFHMHSACQVLRDQRHGINGRGGQTSTYLIWLLLNQNPSLHFQNRKHDGKEDKTSSVGFHLPIFSPCKRSSRPHWQHFTIHFALDTFAGKLRK